MTGLPPGWAGQWFPDLIDVIVRRPGRRDTISQTQLPGTSFPIRGCLLAPSLGSGQAASREGAALEHTVVTGASLLAPAGADILAADRIEAGGVLWEVEGDVGDWGSAGTQVSLRRASG